MTTPLKPIDGDWFQFRSLGEGITLITEPHVIPFLRCNIWHIRGRGLDLMVDTGLGVSSLHAASRHLFGQRVAALATHVHLDHVGSHHEFAECWCHRLEADALAHAERLSAGARGGGRPMSAARPLRRRSLPPGGTARPDGVTAPAASA